MMRGTTTFASATCTATPSTITASTRSQSPVPTTNSAGKSVDTIVPKRSEEHTSELQSPCNLVCRLLLEKKNTDSTPVTTYDLSEVRGSDHYAVQVSGLSLQ